MKIIGIYKIENIITGKVYIGQSINISARIRDHKWRLSLDNHPNNHLQSSWNKYGAAAFVFEIIEEMLAEYLTEAEQYYIDIYNSADRRFGYNKCPSAGSRRGSKSSEETKRKISESLIGNKRGVGRVASEETKKKMKKPHKKFSAETKQKMSESLIGNKRCVGRVLPEETKRKISEAMRESHRLRRESLLKEK